jgi:hypothetical protein
MKGQEIHNWRNTVSNKQCSKCGATKPLTEFYKQKTGSGGYRADCKACKRLQSNSDYHSDPERRREWAEKNSERIAARSREWERNNKSRRNHLTRKRQTAKQQRTPAWADPAKIASFYSEAQRLESITGIPFEVDHIIPLRGKLVSGLHTESNLQLLPRQLNRRKSNSFLV